jgi:hypothetical protein
MAPTSAEEIGKNAKNPEQDLGTIYNVLFYKKNPKKIRSACRPRREHSNALKNVLGSQCEPKNLKGGPHSLTYSLSHCAASRIRGTLSRIQGTKFKIVATTPKITFI